MSINSKNKGSTFERKISTMFSARFATLTGISTSFRRNPDSGAFFGGGNKTRTDTHDTDHANFGDLLCPVNFKFSIECKHYKTPPTFTAIVSGEVKQWDGWLSQVEQDSAKSSKSPLLIVKYNSVRELAIVKQLYSTIPVRLVYKSNYIYTLEDLLTLSDAEFFS
jgi:hypothetical protein